MAESHSSSIDVDASAEELFDIVVDLEAYPDWVQGVKAVEVHEEDGDGRPRRASMTVDAMIREVNYTLNYELEYPDVVSWTAEPGKDLKQIDGSYRFEVNDEGGTTVHYELTIDPNFRIPGFMLKQAQKAIMSSALHGLKSRAEEG